jgi:hypothetical protein
MGCVPKLKRGTWAGGKQLLAATTRVAARAGSVAMRPREEEPAGLFKRRACELGARWRRKSGEGVASGRGICRQWAVGGTAEK